MIEHEIDTTFLTEYLSSKLWRLNNLYWIRDKSGELVTLRLNESQLRVLTQYKHNRKIILKARQQGISTPMTAYNLDTCIFKGGFSAGVQSYGLDEGKKLHDKARLMWDCFDPNIKKLLGLELTADNSHGLQFNNGSILKIGNFRGDTLQALHVSELAKIAKKYPEKAQELKTGAFQAISKDNKITIESTAEGKSGMFYEMWCKAKEKEKLIEQGLAEYAPFDFQTIFLPWMIDNDCRLAYPTIVPPEIDTYLNELEKEVGYEIDQEQRWWYASKYEELGIDIKQEYPSTPDEAFMHNIAGSYYEHEFKTLKIVDCEHDRQRLVHMSCDLGVNDTFVILFFQLTNEGPLILEEHVDSGKVLADYRDIVDAACKRYGWTEGEMYCPFDIKAREQIAGVRLAEMKRLGFRVNVVKKHAVIDGINETRAMLKTTRVHKRCTTLIAAIQSYRKKFDDKYQVFLDSPVHDEHSHPADALRYMAMGIRTKPPVINFVVDKHNSIGQYQNFGLDL